MRKAQAAMEFLMTYGWAIIVLAVVLGTLGYLKVLSPHEMIPERCIFPSGTRLICGGINIETGVAITLKAKNPLVDKVTITSASEISDGKNSCQLSGNKEITGENFGVLVFGQDGSVGSCAGLVAKGAKIKADVKLVVISLDGFEKISAGNIVGKAV